MLTRMRIIFKDRYMKIAHLSWAISINVRYNLNINGNTWSNTVRVTINRVFG